MATIGKSIETVLCGGPHTALQGRWSSSCMAPSRSTGHGMLFRRGDKLCHSWGLGCLDVSQNASLGQNAVRGNMGVSLWRTDVRLNFIRCVRQMGFWWWTICKEVVLKRTDNFLLKDYTSQFFLGPGMATPEERDYRRGGNLIYIWQSFPSLQRSEPYPSCGDSLLQCLVRASFHPLTWHEKSLICQHGVGHTAQPLTWMILSPRPVSANNKVPPS